MRNAFALIGLLAPLSAACASAPMDWSVDSRPLALDVSNHGWSDVVVYLADGGAPVRLGEVPARRQARLFIHRGSGPVRLMVRQAGSRAGYAPEPVWARSGQVVTLTVQPLLSTSDLMVR